MELTFDSVVWTTPESVEVVIASRGTSLLAEGDSGISDVVDEEIGVVFRALGGVLVIAGKADELRRAFLGLARAITPPCPRSLLEYAEAVSDQ